MKSEIQEFILKVENLGWGIVEEGENQYHLNKISPAGQDFSIIIEGKDVQELIGNIYKVYENFDVSEETYLWLDSTGHGTNGAPYHMKDVLKDMEFCESMILELYNELINKV